MREPGFGRAKFLKISGIDRLVGAIFEVNFTSNLKILRIYLASNSVLKTAILKM